MAQRMRASSAPASPVTGDARLPDCSDGARSQRRSVESGSVTSPTTASCGASTSVIAAITLATAGERAGRLLNSRSRGADDEESSSAHSATAPSRLRATPIAPAGSTAPSSCAGRPIEPSSGRSPSASRGVSNDCRCSFAASRTTDAVTSGRALRRSRSRSEAPGSTTTTRTSARCGTIALPAATLCNTASRNSASRSAARSSIEGDCEVGDGCQRNPAGGLPAETLPVLGNRMNRSPAHGAINAGSSAGYREREKSEMTTISRRPRSCASQRVAP